MAAVQLFAACVEAAAALYGHTPAQLWLIHKVEGGAVGYEVANRNGSADLGPFQVNDRAWVPHLAKKLARPQGEIRRALRDNACFNAYAAGYILRLAIDAEGGDVWAGMGRYHSATPHLQAAYQYRLIDAFTASKARPRERQNQRLAAIGAEEDVVRGGRPLR